MHWELWALNTGNLIATPATEAEALALVRELLAKGWSADDLSLGVEDEGRPVESLPPPLEGAALAAHARAMSPPPGDARRSA
jgi:hypothetical protein